LPTSYQDAFQNSLNVRVSIDGLWLPYGNEDTPEELHCRSLFNPNIVSFKGTLTLPEEIFELQRSLRSLKALFVAMKNLEVMRMSTEIDDQWSFEVSGGRLAPLRKLTLENYLWNHRAEDLSKVWDFSKLSSLELIYNTYEGDPLDERLLGKFLRCVTPEHFPQLRKFKCTNDLQPDVAEQAETDRLLGQFIISLKGLHKLSITGCSLTFLIPHITSIGEKLEVLAISVGRHPSKEVMTPHRLGTVLSSCRNLEKLRISCGLVKELVRQTPLLI
jgi:hypothetical protein